MYIFYTFVWIHYNNTEGVETTIEYIHYWETYLLKYIFLYLTE